MCYQLRCIQVEHSGQPKCSNKSAAGHQDVAKEQANKQTALHKLLRPQDNILC